MKKETIALSGLLLVALTLITILILKHPIYQNSNYHLFCNETHVSGVNNFWNVISNLPFLVAGIHGIITTKKQERTELNQLIFFIGVTLVSVGSGYYHLNPNNETLIWDRLPMTIAFTAFVSIVISEFINKSTGKKLLLPLLVLGLCSILYWVNTGDLSFYIFIQFYPIIAIPIVLLVFKSKNHSKKGYWLLILFYLIAKLLETYDHEVFHLLKVVSGHPLKHLSSAIGIILFTVFSLKNQGTKTLA